jgi:drug/metabolite transporter (DMT)-like permease
LVAGHVVEVPFQRPKQPHQNSKMNRIFPAVIGIAPLLVYIATWIIMGELIQGLLTGWPKFWFLTYCIKSGFIFALFPYFLLRRLRVSRPNPPPLPAPLRTLIFTAFALSPISTICTITWYLSLAGTSVAGNSAVYQTATVFALLFSAVILREAVTLRKLGCVACALAGVALVAFGGSSSGGGTRDTLGGYAWCIFSTVLYALYEVLYSKMTGGGKVEAKENNDEDFSPRRRVGEERGEEENRDEEDEGATGTLLGAHSQPPPVTSLLVQSLVKAETAALTLGCIGVATLLTQWPVFFIANATGWEPFSFPPPQDKGRLVALNMVLDSIYNLSLLWGISTSSAFAMQLASTMVVPAGIVGDFLFHGVLPGGWAVGGLVLIVLGVVSLETHWERVVIEAVRGWRGRAT